MDNTPKHLELTEETVDIITVVMNLAEMAADCQIDEDAKDDARTVIQKLAELVGIPSYEVHIEETHNDDGSTDIHIETKAVTHNKRPKLTVISNDNMDKDD